ncbi:hypothetical protein Glove_243g58 [Diversispora epigaea]|uniref:CBM20 domain-containing protein n=1 Tax=Diversispora epigaea TaxID=1348612 RepID=A0A397IEV1_9GLOM|nr:hypothetical protein Glove_243g58 [Diversispora epigaea]
MASTSHLQKDTITSVFYVHLPPDITPKNYLPVVIGSCKSLGEWDVDKPKIILSLQANSTLWKSDPVTIPLNTHIEYKYATFYKGWSQYTCTFEGYEGGRADRLMKFQKNHYDIWQNNRLHIINPIKFQNDFRFVDCIYNSINDQNFKEKIMEFQTICSEHSDYVKSVTKIDFIRNKLSKEKNFLFVLLGYYMECPNKSLFEYILNYLDEEKKRTKTAENDILKDNQRFKEEVKESNKKVNSHNVSKKDNELLKTKNERLRDTSHLKKDTVFHVHLPPDITENHFPVVLVNTINRKIPLSLQPNSTLWKSDLVVIPLNTDVEYKYATREKGFKGFFSNFTYEGRASRRMKSQRNHYDIWQDNYQHSINRRKLKTDFRFIDRIYNSINDENFKDKIMEFQTICSEHREYVISVTKLDFIRNNKLSDFNSKEKNCFVFVLLGYYMKCSNKSLFEYILNYLDEENKGTKTAENDILKDNQRLKEKVKELNKKINGVEQDNKSLITRNNRLDKISDDLRRDNLNLTKDVDKLKVEKINLAKNVDKLKGTVEELDDYSKKVEESNKKQMESLNKNFRAQFEQEKETNKKIVNSLRKKLNDNGNGYFMLSEENAKLKEEASKYQAALGVATNTRLGDDDLNHSVKLKEDIKRLQTLLENYVTHLKPGTDININIEQIQILVQNYDCEIDNPKNPDKPLIKAILQRKVLDFVLEKYNSLLSDHKNDDKDEVQFTHTHQTYNQKNDTDENEYNQKIDTNENKCNQKDETDENKYSQKNDTDEYEYEYEYNQKMDTDENEYNQKMDTDENDPQFIQNHQTSYKDKDENENDDRFLELKIDSKAKELLDLINEFSTTREGTDEVIKVSATKTRQQIYGILGNRGFNKIIHNNEIHEHNFIHKVSNELNNMMDSYRKIKNVERKNNIEEKAPKLIQDICKLFLFRLNVQEPKLEYNFYKVGDEIDSKFMAGSWNDDEIDKLCVDICYFPLIGQNLASTTNKKMYMPAKVVARPKNVLQE